MTKVHPEITKVMQRLLWCSLLIIAFGYASSVFALTPKGKQMAPTHSCIEPAQLSDAITSFPLQPVLLLPEIKDLAQAYCIQRLYVDGLANQLISKSTLSRYKGASDISALKVGYKVGFTGTDGQRRFEIPHPAVGVILQNMLVANNSELPLQFAYRGMVEPDLLVSVKSPDIMQAQTIEQVAQHLDRIYAFLELPSVRFEPSRKITARELIALNVGATKMLVGESIKVAATPDFLKQLQQANTRLLDGKGNLIQQAPMSNLMEHPFNAVLWLIKTLRQQGQTLAKGDYISLGAVGKLFPVKPTDYRYIIAFGEGVSLSANVKFTSLN